MAVELRHLRYFVAVAQEGHVTRAAERLGLQQPPLSQQIKALEREIGVQLFRRKARGVDLTEAGRTLLADALAVLARVDDAVEGTRRTAAGKQGRLRIGMPPSGPFHPFVPRMIRRFREECPLVALSIQECLRAELVEGLQAGTLDVAFIRASIAPPEGLELHPLLEEPLVVALPSTHALARPGPRSAAVSLDRLATEPFIVYARRQGPALYDVTLAACAQAGFSPVLGQETDRIISALSLVASGLGVTLVPASMQSMTMDGVAFRPLRGPAQPKAFLSIAARRNAPSAAVRQFVAMVRRGAREEAAS
ncbi:LysR family transcriptional regulator [Roseomonas sp. CCTCC AB2023176]|uniref:LysR family transcriptional regulator n=1 Tax=Roseomonas sp. CCTCC AB2023176 TaxID=3342640 RepID=UPI0035D87CBE